MVQSGEFDLNGMLAVLKAKKDEIGAKWIVFDGIDVLLTLLQNPVAEMREIYRIRDWLAANQTSAIITAKAEGRTSEIVNYSFMQFMVDCVISFERRLEHGVALHRIEIAKYRGSSFVAGEFPVTFGPAGMDVGAPEPAEIRHEASTERLSAGFERLDTMLGGGLFRGSSTLITGVPGTSKTTLAGKFVEAACRRGERTLFVSFDEGADPIVRNLASVGIALKPHLKSGLLRMYSGRTESIGAEDHLVKIKSLLREHSPQAHSLPSSPVVRGLPRFARCYSYFRHHTPPPQTLAPLPSKSSAFRRSASGNMRVAQLVNPFTISTGVANGSGKYLVCDGRPLRLV